MPQSYLSALGPQQWVGPQQQKKKWPGFVASSVGESSQSPTDVRLYNPTYQDAMSPAYRQAGPITPDYQLEDESPQVTKWPVSPYSPAAQVTQAPRPITSPSIAGAPNDRVGDLRSDFPVQQPPQVPSVLDQPILPLSKLVPEPEAFDPTGSRTDMASNLAHRVLKGGLDAAQGFTTPRNVGIFGAMAAAPVLGPIGAPVSSLADAYFASQMLGEAAGEVPDIRNAMRRGNYGEAISRGTGAGISAAMGGMSLGHMGSQARDLSQSEEAIPAYQKAIQVQSDAAAQQMRNQGTRDRAQQVLRSMPQRQNAAPQFDVNYAQAISPAAKQDSLGFYSALERAISEKMPNAASGQQVLDIVSNPQNAVKKSEVEWSGLPEFLADKPKVTKQEVLEHLRDNKVDLKEITKGGPSPETYQESTNPGRTKYDKYSTPGGENYREVLLTLPKRPLPEWKVVTREEYVASHPLSSVSEAPFITIDAKGDGIASGSSRQEALQKAADYKNTGEKTFQSGHWPEPNVLAHFRLKDFTDKDGNKVLLVDEGQSDWHQTGRSKGYQQPLSTKEAARLAELRQKMYNKGEVPVTQEDRNEFADLAGRNEPEEGQVPNAPFKNNWHELVMKRVMRLAAEEGYDKIAWTTGAMQADRYNLAKHIDELQFHPSPDEQPAGTGVLHGIKNGRIVVNKPMRPEDLEEHIGKELTTKLLANKPAYSIVDTTTSIPSREPKKVGLETWAEFMRERDERVQRTPSNKKAQQLRYQDWLKSGDKTADAAERANETPFEIRDPEGNPYQHRGDYGAIKSRWAKRENAQKVLDEMPHVLKGQDLSIGGEGMKGFYDKMLPNFVDKYAKKWGTKTGDIDLPVGSLHKSDPSYTGQSQKFHSLEVTPSMREGVMMGQPLFARQNSRLSVDEARSKRVSDFYEKAQSTPQDPEVQRAYKAFNAETHAQYLDLVKQGFVFEPSEDAETYKSSKELAADVAQKHLKIWTGGTPEHGLMDQQQNFEFRAVHDVKGHAKGDNTFGHEGEESAYATHYSDYSPEAQKALATETRGQNATLHFSERLKNPAERRNADDLSGGSEFPEQKATILPHDLRYVSPEEIDGLGLASKSQKAPTTPSGKPSLEIRNSRRGETAWTTREGINRISEAIGSGREENTLRAMTINSGSYDRILTALAGTKDPFLQKVSEHIRKSKGKAIQFVPRDLDVSLTKSFLRHEDQHVTQLGLTPDTRTQFSYGDVFLNPLSFRDTIGASDDQWSRITKSLEGNGYDIKNPISVAMETGAYIAAGQWDSLGLGREEALELYSRYIGALVAKHGIDTIAEAYTSLHPEIKKLYDKEITDAAGRQEKFTGYRSQSEARRGEAAGGLQARGSPSNAGGLRQDVPPSYSKGQFERLRPRYDRALAADRFRKFLTRDNEKFAPKNQQVKDSDGVVLAGPVTFQEWQDRVQKYLTPEDIKTYRNWYKDLRPLFVKHFGKKADQYLLGWLMSQKNTSPSGGMLNLQRAIDKHISGLPEVEGAAPGLVDKEAGDILTNKRPTSGYAAKLLDFIDSYLGKNARNIMGYRAAGGKPVAVDIWTTRDTGYIDDVVKGLLQKKGYDVSGLTRDSGISPKGSPHDPQYEYGSKFVNALTNHLNTSGFDGGKWIPSEAQAVGWMAIQKALGVTPEAPTAIFDRNTRRIAAAVAFGSGSPLEKKFGDRYYGLSTEGQQNVTRKVLGDAIDYVQKKVGGTLVQRIDGLGKYGDSKEPSTTLHLLSSPEVAADYHDLLGHLLQQSEVLSYREREKPTGGSRQLIDISGEAMKDPTTRERFLDALTEEAPYIGGATLNSEGLRLLNLHGPKWDLADFEDALNRAAEKAKIDLASIDAHKHWADVDKYDAHDWSKDAKGKTYTDSLKSRGRNQILRDLHSDRGVPEEWLDRHISAEEKRNGSAAADKFGPALARTPIEQASGVNVDPEDYVKLEKTGLAGDVLDALKANYQETVAAKGPFPKDVIGFAQVRDEASKIDPSIVDELDTRTSALQLHDAGVRFAARNTLNNLVRTHYEMTKEVEAGEAKTGLTAELQEKKAKLAAIEDNMRKLTEALYRARSEDGRRLVYNKIIAQEGFDSDYWIGKLRRANGGALDSTQEARARALSGEARGYLDIAGAIGKVGDDTEFNADGSPRKGTIVSFGEDGSIIIKDANGVTHKHVPDEPKILEAAKARWNLGRIRDQFVSLATRAEKDNWLDTINKLIDAGLLSGPRTIGRIVSSNALLRTSEELARYPGALVDAISSVFTGRRSLLAPTGEDLFREGIAGAVKGMHEAVATMKNGRGGGSIAEGRELKSGNKILDTYYSTIMRAHGAAYQFVRQAAIRASLDEQAKLIVGNLVRAGKLPQTEAKTALQGLRDNPTNEMSAHAISAGEIATLTQHNVLSQAWNDMIGALKKSDKGTPNIAGKVTAAALHRIVPFTRVATNELIMMMNYTLGAPVNAARAGYKYGRANDARWRKENGVENKINFKQEQQRAWSQAAGRGTVGVLALYLGYQLAKKNLLTADRLADAGKRNMQEAARRQPDSANIEGTWRNIGNLWLGNMMTVGASLAQAEQEGAKKGDQAKRVAAASTKKIMEMPMMKGSQEAMSAVQDPLGSAPGRYMNSLAGSLVPTFVSDIGSATDSKIRQAEGPGQAIQSRLPYFRNKLPERTDAFGASISKPTGLRTWDWTMPRKGLEGSDPFMAEMLRLGVGIPSVTRQTKPFSQSQVPDETTEEWQARKNFVGQGMEQALRSESSKPSFAGMTDNAKRYHLQAAMAQERKKLESQWERQQSQTTGVNRSLLLRRERLQQKR